MNKARFIYRAAFFSLILLFVAGCAVEPSLRYGFNPEPPRLTSENAAGNPIARKIVVMKPLDIRGHAGTTPGAKAFIPFYPYVKQIREPEAFIYEWNGHRFDYELDFAELVAMDLRAAGIASEVIVSPDPKKIPTLNPSPDKPDFIVRLSLSRLDWQRKFTMYGMSVLGYLPQAFGAPDEYGYSFLEFTAEVLDYQGKSIAKRKFSAMESQNCWIYYYTGFLRALTDAYVKVSPELRNFVLSSIKSYTSN